MAHHWRFILLVTTAALVAVVLLFEPDLLSEFAGWFGRGHISEIVADAGIWGPVAVIFLMTVAVVFSPIPSAPIALAAGAAYGHYFGALYVVIGAESGAMIAFGLARYLGRETLRKWFGDKLSGFGLLGSQSFLMWVIFASRLMPFLSFDLVSYAAGLSPLTFWRFAIATCAGIIPASVFLTHFGGEMVSGNFGSTLWLALGLGVVTGLPVIWGVLRKKRS